MVYCCLDYCSFLERMLKVATAVHVVLVLDAIIMIIFILLRSGKSAGLSSAISGGAEQLFGKQKARGMELVLHRGTVITPAVFFVLAFNSGCISYSCMVCIITLL